MTTPDEHTYSELIPRPDPTRLTSEAVERATAQYRRELGQLREVIETRLAAMDTASGLLSIRVTELSSTLDDKSRQRHDTLQTLLEQRLDGMDKAAELLAQHVDQIPADATTARGHVREEFAAADTSLRELLGARIDGMDQATKLLAVNMDKVPSDIDRAIDASQRVLVGEIAKVREVTLEKFAAVDALFASNATALTAALAAQEKAVAEQNKSNTLAIDKSEAATKETIAANANQTETGLRGLGTVLDDLKSRVVRLEGLVQNQRLASEDNLAVSTFGQTAEQNRMVQGRTNVQLAIAAFSALVAIAAVVFAVIHHLPGEPSCSD